MGQNRVIGPNKHRKKDNKPKYDNNQKYINRPKGASLNTYMRIDKDIGYITVMLGTYSNNQIAR